MKPEAGISLHCSNSHTEPAAVPALLLPLPPGPLINPPLLLLLLLP